MTVAQTAAMIPQQPKGESEPWLDLCAVSLPVKPFRPNPKKALPGWASFTADGFTLAVRVHPHVSWEMVEKALAYGLFHAAGLQRLAMVLPATGDKTHDAVQATLIRSAFVDKTVEVFSYEGDEITALPPMSDLEAFAALREPSIGHDMWELTDKDQARVEDLAIWADRQSGLARVHLKHYLAWHCAGRQLLKIHGGKKATLITAGVDYSKPDLAAGQEPPLQMSLSSAITPEQLATVQVKILQGMLHRVCTFDDAPMDSTHAEHRLQAAMASAAEGLGWGDPRHVRREFPVRRPGGGRGFIDLLRVDSKGVLRIVETKIGHDEMLVLQGLDYWIWAQANLPELVKMMGPISGMAIDFVVSMPAGRRFKQGDKLLSPYAERHLAMLHNRIERNVEVVEGWQPRPMSPAVRNPESVGG
jgi:hypothetical protein